jgi:hypothetical protein
MGAGEGAQRFARPIAEIIGLAAEDGVVRYGVMSLTFLFLAVAAYLFGPAAPLEAVGVLGVAYALIFFTIYWWFLEEARKRRIMLGYEPPRAHDASNPDLRDEVIFSCAVLFLVTPLLLQTLNDTSLHYAVAQDGLGLKTLVCADAHQTSFCAQNGRLFELPSWLFFTLQSFITTLPMADQIGDIAANMTGVHPTAATPAFVGTSLRFIFGGFLLTIVVGMFNKVGRQIDAAVEALILSPQLAAGMGPIILIRLQKVLADEQDQVRWQNATLAISDIAERYPGAQEEIQRLFAADFEARFSAVPVRSNDENVRSWLGVLASALVAMRSRVGIRAVRERILKAEEYEATKQRLVREVVASLDPDEAAEQLRLMQTTGMKKTLARQIENALAQLKAASAPNGDDADPLPILSGPPDGGVSVLADAGP